MVKVLKAEEAKINGTYLVGYLEDVNFMDLVTGLGEPTFDNPSGDDKVQVEWVCKFNGKIFTIYDWKTYDREFTEHSLTKFNVGSKDVSGLEVQEFIEFVKGQIEYAYDNFDLP
jgi:hypothetical protein